MNMCWFVELFVFEGFSNTNKASTGKHALPNDIGGHQNKRMVLDSNEKIGLNTERKLQSPFLKSSLNVAYVS